MTAICPMIEPPTAAKNTRLVDRPMVKTDLVCKRHQNLDDYFQKTKHFYD